jgi:hypothetical protein
MVVGATVWIAALVLIVRDRAFRGSWRARIAVTALTIAGVIAAEIVRRGNLLELRWVLIAHIASGTIATAALAPLAWRLAASKRGRREREVCDQAMPCDRDARSAPQQRTIRRTRSGGRSLLRNRSARVA